MLVVLDDQTLWWGSRIGKKTHLESAVLQVLLASFVVLRVSVMVLHVYNLLCSQKLALWIYEIFVRCEYEKTVPRLCY